MFAEFIGARLCERRPLTADAAKAPVLFFMWLGKKFVAEVIELLKQRLMENSTSTCVRAKSTGVWEGNCGLETIVVLAKIRLLIRVRHQ